MKTLSKVALAAVATLAFAPVTAQAQQQNLQCGPRQDMIESIAGQYNETHQFEMLGSQGESVYEIFANESSGSWTTIQTTTDGQS